MMAHLADETDLASSPTPPPPQKNESGHYASNNGQNPPAAVYVKGPDKTAGSAGFRCDVHSARNTKKMVQVQPISADLSPVSLFSSLFLAITKPMSSKSTPNPPQTEITDQQDGAGYWCPVLGLPETERIDAIRVNWHITRVTARELRHTSSVKGDI